MYNVMYIDVHVYAHVHLHMLILYAGSLSSKVQRSSSHQSAMVHEYGANNCYALHETEAKRKSKSVIFTFQGIGLFFLHCYFYQGMDSGWDGHAFGVRII